jgi:agmatine deiminase
MSNLDVTQQIIQELLPYVPVKMVVPNDSLLQVAQLRLPAKSFETGRLELLKIPYNEFWARDMGPAFVLKDNRLTIADFQFNAWGMYDTLNPYSQKDEKLDERSAAILQVPLLHSPLVSEGGGHESNGKGTLLLVEAVELGRNPGMTKARIEAEYKRVTGATHFVWLKQGVREDDHTQLGPIPAPGGVEAYTVLTTNGHVDEFARFANDSTILLAQVDSADLATDPIAQENHRRLEENYQLLKNARDQDGRPFKIVRMPMPPTILWKMQPEDPVYQVMAQMDFPKDRPFPQGKEITVVAAASYLNFLISNDIVIGQQYWKPGWPLTVKERDERAKAILQQVFPHRKIVMLDALSVNWGGGGIHCITMHQPKAPE